MDLKLKDVADLLLVSEVTIRKWIAGGQIPHYRLQNQFRFNRGEIDEWMMTQHIEHPLFPVSKKGGEGKGVQQFGLYRALHKGNVYRDIVGNTKEEVIGQVVQRLSLQLRIDPVVLFELLLERERMMPTSLSDGVAVPHTRDFLLQEAYDIVTVVYLDHPIEYGAFDRKKVDILFFLFACDDKRHLHLLAKIAHLHMQEKGRAFLRGRPDKEALLSFVKEWEGAL